MVDSPTKMSVWGGKNRNKNTLPGIDMGWELSNILDSVWLLSRVFDHINLSNIEG